MKTGKSIFMIFPMIETIESYLERKKLLNQHEHDFAEFKIYKYLTLFPLLKMKYKKDYFLQMQKEFRDLDLTSKLEIITQSELKNYNIIIKKKFIAAFVILKMKDMVGKMLSISIFKFMFISLKNK